MVYEVNVQEYIREDGTSPYEEWFNTLDHVAAAKITVAISRMELGNTSNIYIIVKVPRSSTGPIKSIYYGRNTCPHRAYCDADKH